jgi:hypothetical protein
MSSNKTATDEEVEDLRTWTADLSVGAEEDLDSQEYQEYTSLVGGSSDPDTSLAQLECY